MSEKRICFVKGKKERQWTEKEMREFSERFAENVKEAHERFRIAHIRSMEKAAVTFLD